MTLGGFAFGNGASRGFLTSAPDLLIDEGDLVRF